MKGGGSGWIDTSRPTGGGYSPCAAALCPSFLGLIVYLLVRGTYSNWKCPRCGGAVRETTSPMELNALMTWEEPEFQFEVEASEEVCREYAAEEHHE